MKRLLIAALTVLGLISLANGSALAQPRPHVEASATCSMAPTVQSVRGCVEHARQIGAIDSDGVTRNLLVKLDVAQSALDRGRPRVAIALLRAFVREVDALAGKHIAPPHADDLVMHARLVIQALHG